MTALVSKYLENKEKFNLFLSLKEVVLTLNNITHVTTKKKPYEVFYSSNEKLFEIVKNNTINYSKNINKECSAIKKYDTILVNNFISNYNLKKNLNYSERNRIKKKNVLFNICATVNKCLNNYNYEIIIEKDYLCYDFLKDSKCVDPINLIKKVSYETWIKILNNN